MTATATDWSGSDCRFPTGMASIVYLTGVSTELTRKVAPGHETLGLLCTPDSAVHNQIPLYEYWAADNGCFTKGDRFDDGAWLAWLEAQTIRLDSCLFAVLPDVVGDATATWKRSSRYADRVRSLGYPVALAAQDGLENIAVPWDEIDCLFIGGSTEWKLSEHAIRLGAEARDRGLWTHVGRVNTWRRLQWANSAGFDSADGTLLAFGPDVNGPKLLGWLERLARQRPFTRLEDA